MRFSIKIMHAGISTRFWIVQDFNDDTYKMQTLICMLNVSTLGLDLQKDMRERGVMETAISTAADIQGWGEKR